MVRDGQCMEDVMDLNVAAVIAEYAVCDCSSCAAKLEMVDKAVMEWSGLSIFGFAECQCAQCQHMFSEMSTQQCSHCGDMICDQCWEWHPCHRVRRRKTKRERRKSKQRRRQ